MIELVDVLPGKYLKQVYKSASAVDILVKLRKAVVLESVVVF